MTLPVQNRPSEVLGHAGSIRNSGKTAAPVELCLAIAVDFIHEQRNQL